MVAPLGPRTDDARRWIVQSNPRAGTHQIKFDGAGKPLEGLTPGKYQLVIEAAREVGGRELLKIPFEWPPKAPATSDSKVNVSLARSH